MKQDVTVVGAGVDGIMTALYMADAGCKVRLVAKTPDPRKIIDAGDYFASSWDSQQTRYITLYEGHPYLRSSPMYPNMKEAFAKPLTEGGWLGKHLKSYNHEEQSWLAKRDKITDQEEFYKDSFKWYVDANRMAMDEWDKLRETHPFLFKNANVQDDIVRIYDNAKLYEWAKELHDKDGVLLSSTEGAAIGAEYPHLREAYANGQIHGVIKVRGFSFDVQRFMLNALAYLEQSGAEIMFDTEVTRIARNPGGEVTGLEASQNGREIRLESTNYSLHMGAYDVRGLLKDTPAEGAIAGMEGRWTVMDAPEGMKHSLKLHGDMYEVNGQQRPVIDQNHAVFETESGTKALIGFGYLFSGFNPKGVDSVQKRANDEGNHAIIRRMFPSHYAEQEKKDSILWVDRGCVRTFTFDDLVRNDILQTLGGGKLLINGGGNTGSATQSPTQALQNLFALGVRENLPWAIVERLNELHNRSNSIILS
jgi:glycine/D-amino acid oxidase-like deaminating enzyme